MIIEIKDLPQDRNVKKVTFDIEFEDGEVQTVVQTPQVVKISGIKPDDIPTIDTTKTTGVNEGPQITNENRPQKEIPSEMTDMVF